MAAICDLIERRYKWTQGGDPRTPQYWVKKLFGARESWSGLDVDEDKALSYSAVWNAVNIIAGAIGFLPLIVYKREDRSRSRATVHPVYKLLHDRPNPYMDALIFDETIQGHVLTWGNGYAEIERDGAGRPIALWPLLPNRVTPEVIDASLLRYKVDHKDGTWTYLPYQNVLHIKGLGFDGIKGYSVINYAGQNFAFGLAVEKFGAVFFKNEASPRGIIELPPGASLTKAQQESLKKSWEEGHKGLDDKHRMAVFEEGMKWHQIGISPEDAQMLETRKFNVTDVARWFDIPPHMLKDLSRATFSNIEHQGLYFVMWTLAKWLRRWELETKYKLFGTEETDYYTEFLTDALLRGDTKSRYAAYREARQGGWMSINDVRERENMDPVDGGNTYLEPLNMKPVGAPWPEPQAKPLSRTMDVLDLLEHVCERVVTKEVNALRKMSQKSDDFRSRVDAFYEQHAGHLRSVLEPVLKACQDYIPDTIELKTLADDYVTAHRQSINRILDNTDGEQLSELVEPILDNWAATSSLYLANRLMLKEQRNALS